MTTIRSMSAGPLPGNFVPTQIVNAIVICTPYRICLWILDMDRSAAEEFIKELFSTVLRRAPGPDELLRWGKIAQEARSPSDVLVAIRKSTEYIKKHSIKTFVPNGHYYSPVVDPSSIKDYY